MLTAHYFDGRSARLHPARLSIEDGLATLHGPGKTYPVRDIRLAEPFEGAPAILYFADGACCEIPGPRPDGLLEEALGYRRSLVVRWQARVRGALLALALLVALLAWSVGWGLPALGERIAEQVPPSVDRSFGEQALVAMEKSRILLPSRLEGRHAAILSQILARIAPPGMRVRVLLRHSPYFGANAIALPDGTIVMTDLMARLVLDDASQIDERQQNALAGILAHEIGHVQLRHTIREVTSSSLTAALSSALLGDFSGAAAIPATLGELSFSRDMETEADEYAIGLLRSNGISTLPLADLLDWLEQAESEQSDEDEDILPSWLEESGSNFFDTHPVTAERTVRLRAAAQPRPRPIQP